MIISSRFHIYIRIALFYFVEFLEAMQTSTIEARRYKFLGEKKKLLIDYLINNKVDEEYDRYDPQKDEELQK